MRQIWGPAGGGVTSGDFCISVPALTTCPYHPAKSLARGPGTSGHFCFDDTQEPCFGGAPLACSSKQSVPLLRPQTAIEITLATNLVDGISGLTRPHCGSDMSRCVPELQKTPTAATHIIFQFWYPIA